MFRKVVYKHFKRMEKSLKSFKQERDMITLVFLFLKSSLFWLFILCVCVCVYVCAHTHTRVHAHTFIHAAMSNSLQPYGPQPPRLSKEVSKQEHWSELPFPPPGDILNLGGFVGSDPHLLHWQAEALPLSHLAF